MVQCANGHLFCYQCVGRQVEEILIGYLAAHSSLPCMYTDSCNESIPLCEIRRALPNDIFERYEERLAQRAIIKVIIEAKLENLVYCPFCNIPYEVDECVQVLDCPNPQCLKASCIQCKEASHLPLRCEEAEKLSETAVRRKVEERMAKAVIRQCNTCKAELVKIDDGCNKLTCTMCERAMCYSCRQTVSSGDSHFCIHWIREEGETCVFCDNKRCSMYGTEVEVEDNVALDAKEEALKEFTDLHGHGQEIGPPLVRKAQPVRNGREPVLPNDIEHFIQLHPVRIGREPVLPNDIEQFIQLNPELFEIVTPPEQLQALGDEFHGFNFVYPQVVYRAPQTKEYHGTQGYRAEDDDLQNK